LKERSFRWREVRRLSEAAYRTMVWPVVLPDKVDHHEMGLARLTSAAANSVAIETLMIPDRNPHPSVRGLVSPDQVRYLFA